MNATEERNGFPFRASNKARFIQRVACYLLQAKRTAMDRSRALVPMRANLVRYLLRRGVDQADAEDAVHAVFVKLLSLNFQIPIFSEEPGAREQYLKTACLNAVRSQYRAFTRRKGRERAWCEDTVRTAFAEYAESREQDRLEVSIALSTMLDALPLSMVRAFVLCELQGMPAATAATALDVPVGTVKTWRRRARSFLRQLVGA
jgi:RNA polymerase sigma factor (sigma-70 family)